MKVDIYHEIASNKRRTYGLIIVFVLFIGLLGLVFSMALSYGIFGLPIAIGIAVIISLVQYYKGDQLVLKVSGAKPVEKGEYPHLYNVTEGISIAAGVPMPKLYIIDDTAPNAFATGRDPEHSSVAVTKGLLQKLNRAELEGVIAHEMSHIKNYDIKIMTVSVALVGVVVMLSDFILRSFFFGGMRRNEGKQSAILLGVAIVFAVLAPIFATMIRMGISRQREYLADASGAMLTRYPEGLASALEKLSKDKEPLEVANKATSHLYIVTPINVKMVGLFSTHPPIEERIKRLRGM